MSVQVLHNGATLAGALLFYYDFPISGESSPLWQWLLFVVGLGLLIWWIVRELRRQLTAGSKGVRVRNLITLLLQDLGRSHHRGAGVPADRSMGCAALPAAAHDPTLVVAAGSGHPRR